MDENVVWQMRRMYNKTLRKLRKKSEMGERIRIGFAVVFDSVFPMAPVFEEMLGDRFFDPFLIVIPDTSRGQRHGLEVFARTEDRLRKKYGEIAQIVPAMNMENLEPVAIHEMCDMYCTANPYDEMTSSEFGVTGFLRRGIPVFFADYGFAISSFYDKIMKDPFHYGKFWRVFCETAYVYDLMNTHLPWCEPVYSGYPKMDKLATYTPTPKNRKKIIIAPHHTVGKHVEGYVNFSNFSRFHEFFLELPKLYPQIDFVFRPHPLMFTALCASRNWGYEKTRAYFDKMGVNPNVEVQNGGDYLETFVNSDALIHDCGSFTAEYLYLDKPVCRMLREDDDLRKEYNSLALECLECHELARSREDILRFIDQTVLLGNDGKSVLRQNMARKLKKNYPHVSRFIVKNIKASIQGAE